MSIIYNSLHKKEGDRCPACYSNDTKTPKGTLQIKGKSWGLKCTVCKYTVLKHTSNSPRSRVIRRMFKKY